MALAPALTAGFVTGPFVSYGPILNPSMRSMLQSFFISLIPENRMTQRVTRYARAQPAIQKEMNLIELEIARTLRVEDDRSRLIVRRQISEKIHKDFNRGHTLSVDGWLLAKTEVAVIALAGSHRKS